MSRLLFTPADYQREVVKWLVSNSGMLVAPMGSGKTVTTATALQHLLRKGHVRHAWIFAPKQVAARTWDLELRKWEHLRWLDERTGRVARQSGPDWAQARFPVAIAAFDHLDVVIKAVDPARDLIILDECTKFKGADSKRMKGFVQNLRGGAKRVWGLTASPVTEGDYSQLWGQWLALDGGRRLGATITEFRDEYMRQGKSRQRWDWEMMPGAEARLLSRIADGTYRIEEALVASQRPELIVSTVWVEMPADLKATHDTLLKSCVFVDPRTGQMQLVPNAGVAMGKCHQLVGGGMFVNATDPADFGFDPSVRQVIEHRDQVKIDAVAEIIAGYPKGTNIAVAYWYRHEGDRLRRRFPHIRDAREPGIVDAWNRKEIGLMGVHPASVGHGMNLQFGGHVLAMMSLPWSGELYNQLIGRFWRQGQTEGVFVHRVVGIDTIDERVIEGWEMKQTVQERVLASLARDS